MELFFNPPVRRRDRHDRLIPMINIVFLLLIFFMIAGAFQTDEPFDITAPHVQGDGLVKHRPLLLAVNKEGRIAFQGKEMKIEHALLKIEEQQAKNPAEELYIKADRDLKAGIILPILQKLNAGGIHSIRLIALKKPGHD